MDFERIDAFESLDLVVLPATDCLVRDFFVMALEALD